MQFTYDFEKACSGIPTCEQALLAAAEVLCRVYSQKAVIDAWNRVNPDILEIVEAEKEPRTIQE